MIDYEKLTAKLEFMLRNQIELEVEHRVLPPWNKGYKAAVEDVLHYLEHGDE